MKKQYYAHVDGLRAVAVLSVLLFHLDVTAFSGGYVGVDIFLVISGFLITLLLKKEVEATGTLRLGEFYIRRIKRILPALVVMLTLSFIFASFIYSPNHLQTIAGSLWSAMFGLSNFYFWFEADYFDTSTKLKPFLHTWSLGVEEQFYLLWSFTMVIVYKLGLRKILLPFMVVAFAVSLFLNYKLADGQSWFITKHLPALAKLIMDGKSTLFYLLPFRIYEFAVGAILAYLFAYKIASKLVNDALFIAGLGLIAYALFMFDEQLLFPYFYGLVPTIGAALVIFSGGSSRLSPLLGNRLMVGIGLISYSLYLAHWPLISFYHYLHDEQAITFLAQIGISIASVLLAFLMYKFVETPLRKPNYFSQKKYRFVSAVSIFSLVVALAAHAYKHQGWEWRIGAPVVNIDVVEDSKAFHKEYYGGAGYPFYGAVKNKKGPDLIVLGDSHGRHYAEGLYKVIAEPNGFSFYVAAGTSCYHMPDFTRTDAGKNFDKTCPERIVKAKSFIAKSDIPPVVVLSHSWNSQMGRADLLDKNGQRKGVKINVEHLKEGILRLKKEIGDSPLVVIGNVPRAGANLYDVFTRPRPLMFSGFNPDEYLWRARDVKLEHTNQELKKLAEETDSFIFLDPFDVLCDKQRCRNIDGQRRLIYSDEGHMSKFGSIEVVEGFKPQLLKLLKERHNIKSPPYDSI